MSELEPYSIPDTKQDIVDTLIRHRYADPSSDTARFLQISLQYAPSTYSRPISKNNLITIESAGIRGRYNMSTTARMSPEESENNRQLDVYFRRTMRSGVSAVVSLLHEIEEGPETLGEDYLSSNMNDNDTLDGVHGKKGKQYHNRLAAGEVVDFVIHRPTTTGSERHFKEIHALLNGKRGKLPVLQVIGAEFDTEQPIEVYEAFRVRMGLAPVRFIPIVDVAGTLEKDNRQAGFIPDSDKQMIHPLFVNEPDTETQSESMSHTASEVVFDGLNKVISWGRRFYRHH